VTDQEAQQVSQNGPGGEASASGEARHEATDVLGAMEATSAKPTRRTRLVWTAVLCVVGLAVAGVGLLVLRPAPPPAQGRTAADGIPTSEPTTRFSPLSRPSLAASEPARQLFSWQQAREAFRRGDYRRALAAFSQLQTQLAQTLSQGRKAGCISSYITLRIGQCLLRSGDRNGREHLERVAADWCPSPAVRAIANLELARLHEADGDWMRARTRAYLALSVAAALYEDEAFTRQCDYLIARVLTNRALAFYSPSEPVPWSHEEGCDPLVGLSQQQLGRQLLEGCDQLVDATMIARIGKPTDEPTSPGFSACCWRTPLEVFFEAFATRGKFELSWSGVSNGARHRQITLYVPDATDLRICEIAAGSVGLIARFTGKDVIIADPQACQTVGQRRELLVKETRSAWRRVLLAHSDDPRAAQGHFALALLSELDSQPLEAMAEYGLIADRYASSAVAPLSLLRCAKLLIELKNYSGAAERLNSLLDRYPHCAQVGDAYAALGQAVMASGRYDEAFKIFKKLYFLDLSASSRRFASAKAGMCMFRMARFEESIKWLNEYLNLRGNRGAGDPIDIIDVYMTLARSYEQIGDASAAIKLFAATSRFAVGSTRNEAILELARVFWKGGQPGRAVAVLERVPLDQLTDQQKFTHLSLMGEIYSGIGLPEAAIRTLRNGMRVVKSPSLRSRLGLKLAECYRMSRQPQRAYEILSEVAAALPPGPEAAGATYQLAEISIQLGQPQRAAAALEGLEISQLQQHKPEALSVLAKAYLQAGRYDRAVAILSRSGREDNVR